MSDLDRIISINIDRQTKAVSQAGFGVLLAIAPLAEKPVGQTSRVREYTADSFGDDFESTDAIYKALSAFFSQALQPAKVLVGYVEAAETLSDALDAIEQERPDFYAVALAGAIVPADQVLLATWIETRRKVAGVRTADVTALDVTTTDIGAVLDTANRNRTFAFYSSKAGTEFPEFAWFGRCLPTEPGSITWKFKTLSGVSAEALTATGRTNLRNKHYNYFNSVGGVDITEEGWMAGGAFIDEIRGVDWIHARMQEAIFSRLVNLPKVPYTDAGIDVIVNEMEAVLKRAIDQAILDGGRPFSVTRPKINDIPFNDRATRVLNGLKFNGYLAGAIHEVKINGTVTV